MASNHQVDDSGSPSHGARSNMPRMSTFAYHTHKLRLMLKVDAPESKDEEHGSPTEAHGDSKDDHGSIIHSVRDSMVDDMSIYLESQPEIVKVCCTQTDFIVDSQCVSVRNRRINRAFQRESATLLELFFDLWFVATLNIFASVCFLHLVRPRSSKSVG